MLNKYNFLKYYKNLINTNFTELKSSLGKLRNFKEIFNNRENYQERAISLIIVFSLILFLLIAGVEFISYQSHKANSQVITNGSSSISKTSSVNKNTPIYFDKEAIQTNDINKSIGFDLLDPLTSMFSPVVDAITSMIKQSVGLFDNYVAFTPNIANNDGNIKDASNQNLNIGVDKFYDVITKIAWLLLPLLIMINGIAIVLEGDFKGRILLNEIMKKVILFVIAMVAFRFFLSIGINLANDINQIVIKALIGNNQSNSLSAALLTALGIDPNNPTLTLSDQGAFNVVSQALIWIGFFFFLIMLMFQFIIRFFHLWLHLVFYPIELVISLLPGGGQIFKSYIEEIIRTLAVQPVFLVGLAMIIAIINSGTGSVTKLMLGIGSLAFLNTIPSIVNRFSGVIWSVAGAASAGIVGMATVGQARLMKRAVTSGITGENSGSLRRWAGKSFGQALTGKLGSTNDKFTSNIAPKTSHINNPIDQRGNKTFGELIKSGNRSERNSVFETLGMKPLSGLKTEGVKTLFSNKADFSHLSEISAKDGKSLENTFSKNNLSSFYSDQPVTLPQVTDLSKFNAVHSNTERIIPSVVQSTQTNVRLGKTFDSGNADQWNHLSDWYSKTNAGNMHPQDVKTYVSNPINRHAIINSGIEQGYFQAQKIKAIKIQEQLKDQAAVTKYYKVKPLTKTKLNK